MPMKWVEPEVMETFNGRKIYRTYKEHQFYRPNHWWYTTSELEEEGLEFDVRDLQFPDTELTEMQKNCSETDTTTIRKLLREAVRYKLIKFPDAKRKRRTAFWEPRK